MNEMQSLFTEFKFFCPFGLLECVYCRNSKTPWAGEQQVRKTWASGYGIH